MMTLITHKGETTQQPPDFYASVLVDILKWGDVVQEEEIPSYVYDHREEYIIEILQELEEEERQFIQLEYEYAEADDVEKTEILKRLEMSEEEFVDTYMTALRQMASMENYFYLKNGYHYGGKLTMGDSPLKDSAEKLRLRRKVLAELEAEQSLVTWDGEQSIDEYELSVRAYNCLRRAGIKTTGQLMKLTGEDLFELPNIGKKAMIEIEMLQDRIRGGQFWERGHHIFDMDLPYDVMDLLVEKGCLFWEDMKKDLDRVGEWIAGMENASYVKRFAYLRKDEERRGLIGEEKTIFTFSSRKDADPFLDDKEYYVELEDEIKEYFEEDAVIYLYKENCLAVCRPDKFERLIERVKNTSPAGNGERVLRHLVGTAVYTSEEFDYLCLREYQIKYMWLEREKEPDGFTFIKTEGTGEIDYLICVTNGDSDPVLYGEEKLESKQIESFGKITELMYRIRYYSYEED